jgi:hypothetical protein
MSDSQLVDRDQIEARLEEIQSEILRLFEYNRKLDDWIRRGSDLAPTLRSVVNLNDRQIEKLSEKYSRLAERVSKPL